MIRRFAWLAPLALLAACSAPKPERAAPRLVFRDLFSAADTVALSAGTDSLGTVASALVRDSDVVIVDETGANLKVFSRRTGVLQQTLGRAGDGPGEFRQPIDIAALDSGRFAVLDQRRRILSIRKADGTVVDETPGLKGFFNGMVVLPDRHRVVLSGTLFARQGGAGDEDLHEFDYSGKRETSYVNRLPARSKWEQAINAVFEANAGDQIVSGTLHSNRLRVFDRQTGQTRVIDVAPSWYQPLEYPSDAALAKGVSMQSVAQRVTAYMHTQRLMNGVFALPDGAFLVRFMAFTSPKDKAFFYALVDGTGNTRVVTQATRANIVAARGDTVFWMSDGPKGAPRLSTGVLSRTLFTSAGAQTVGRVDDHARSGM